MIQTDQYGFKHYEWSSPSWILVKSIWDLVDVSPEYNDLYKVKLGRKYVIYSTLRNVYELYEITEHTRAETLKPYVKQGRIYLLSS